MAERPSDPSIDGPRLDSRSGTAGQTTPTTTGTKPVIPHDINPQRFQSLLRYGIDGDSLFQFFRESKAALLSAGAKVDNLPPSPDAARKIISGFNAKAHRIFGKWIAAKAERGMTTIEPADELVDRLRAIELG